MTGRVCIMQTLAYLLPVLTNAVARAEAEAEEASKLKKAKRAFVGTLQVVPWPLPPENSKQATFEASSLTISRIVDIVFLIDSAIFLVYKMSHTENGSFAIQLLPKQLPKWPPKQPKQTAETYSRNTLPEGLQPCSRSTAGCRKDLLPRPPSRVD